MKMSEYENFGSFLTGYPSIDHYLKGFPRGHFMQLSGRESSYKTTLAHNAFGNIQRTYGDSIRYLYIDTEGNVDKEYFDFCGGDVDITDFLQENKEEEVLELAFKYILDGNKEGKPSLVCIDSIAGFTTEHEIKQGISKATMGDVPKILNRFLRLSVIPLKRYGSSVVFTNQLRDNLSSQWGGTTTPGGRGMKHWSKYMINMYDLSSKSKMFDLNGVKGHPVSFKVEKGKNLTVHKGFTFDMDITFEEGFSRAMDILNFGVVNEFIVQTGAYYTLPTGERVHGKANLYELIKNEEGLEDSLYNDMLGLDKPEN